MEILPTPKIAEMAHFSIYLLTPHLQGSLLHKAHLQALTLADILHVYSLEDYLAAYRLVKATQSSSEGIAGILYLGDSYSTNEKNLTPALEI